MSTRRFALASILAGLLLLGPACIYAQIADGSIAGIVADPTGGAVAGASVAATNTASGVLTKTRTTSIGYYEFPLLIAGEYKVSVEHPGFQRAVTAAVTLHAGEKVRIDIALTLGQETQSVQVTAEAPLVNATTTDLGTVIESRQIRDLPLNGRIFLNMLTLEPGWNKGNVYAARGGASLSGLPGLGNNYLLDGVDMSFGENNGVGMSAINGASGMLIFYASVDALQEMRATTGAASAEYGRVDGGTVTLTSKSGTNHFHGTLWEYLRNDALTASTFFSNANGLPKPELRQNQFGGNIGGPIIRDRLFFFFNYEGARAVRGQTVSGNVPSASLIAQETNPQLAAFLQTWYPAPTTSTSNPLVGQHFRNTAQRDTEDTTLTRIDGSFGKHNLSARAVINDQTLANPVLSPKLFQYFPMTTRAYEGSWTFMLRPTLVNSLRFGYNHDPLARHTSATDPSLNSNVPGVGQLPTQAYAVSAPGLTSLSTVDALASDAPTYSVIDDLTWVRGAHTIKTGISFRKTNSKRTQLGIVGYNYNSIPNLIADSALSFELDFGNPGRGISFNTLDTYVQDNWKVNRRLTLNYGLHYSYFQAFQGPIGLATSNPFGATTPLGAPIWRQNYRDFSPRLGIVYALTGDGRTIFRAGGGTFYAAPQPWNVYNSNWISAAFASFPTVAPTDLPPTLSTKFPGVSDAYLDQVRKDPSAGPQGLAGGRYGVDPNHHDEYSVQYNATIERQIMPSLVVNASYVGNRVLHEYSTVLENPLNPSNGIRPFANIGPVNLVTYSGRLWFNGLEMAIRKKTSHGMSFDAYYTFSKSMSYGAADQNSSTDSVTQDFSNIRGSIGPTANEVRHRFTADYAYQIPTVSFAKNSAVGRAILANWSFLGILGASSGQALNVVTGVDAVGVGYTAGQRPDPVLGVSPYLRSPNKVYFLNSAAFDGATPRTQKRFGTLGYDTVRGPGSFTWDASLHKSWQIREGQELTLRCEMFNALNHVVLGNPSTTTSSATFGLITSGSDGRAVQFALRYTF